MRAASSPLHCIDRCIKFSSLQLQLQFPTNHYKLSYVIILVKREFHCGRTRRSLDTISKSQVFRAVRNRPQSARLAEWPRRRTPGTPGENRKEGRKEGRKGGRKERTTISLKCFCDLLAVGNQRVSESLFRLVASIFERRDFSLPRVNSKRSGWKF